MQQGNITLVRGDDQTIGVTVLTSSGTAFDLTNYNLYLTVCQSQQYFSPPILIEQTLTGQHINATGGLTQITFIGSNTAGMDDLLHFYNIKLISASGTINPSGITTTTLMYGNFQVLPF